MISTLTVDGTTLKKELTEVPHFVELIGDLFSSPGLSVDLVLVNNLHLLVGREINFHTHIQVLFNALDLLLGRFDCFL